MSRCGKPMTTTMKLGVAMFAAALLAAPAMAEDHEEREPDAPTVEAPDDPARIVLGVDCTQPLTVSLPDDVLTECEAQ